VSEANGANESELDCTEVQFKPRLPLYGVWVAWIWKGEARLF